MFRSFIVFCLCACVIPAVAQQRCDERYQDPFDYSLSIFPREQAVEIPVVFHNVYRLQEQAVSDATIKELLATLNNASDGTLSGNSELPSSVHPNFGVLGYKFRLADFDPKGTASNGIIRKSTSIIDIGSIEDNEGISLIKNSDAGGSDPWDEDRYLNIWIGERSLSLGATITDNSNSQDHQGIVLSLESVIPGGKTIIHEVGHYFGLLHPWGNERGCDDEEDGIADTPFQEGPRFSCESIVDCDSYSETGNFMDFIPDECMWYFTKLQVTAMHDFTQTYKELLFQSDACFVQNLPDSHSFHYNGRSIEIYINDDNVAIDVELYSMDGKRYFSSNSEGENYLNIRTYGIPSGIYVLVFSKAGKTAVERLFIY